MIRTNKRQTKNQRSPLLPDQEKRPCYYCTHNIKEIDYKQTQTFQKFISNYARILPGKRTGACAKHQRKLAQAIKQARFMALIPFSNK